MYAIRSYYVITSIASMKNRAQIKINKIKEQDDSLLLNEMAKMGINIDLINIFVDSFVFTIDMNDIKKAKEIFDEKNLDYVLFENLCKVTAIGTKMHGVPGVMATIVRNNFV